MNGISQTANKGSWARCCVPAHQGTGSLGWWLWIMLCWLQQLWDRVDRCSASQVTHCGQPRAGNRVTDRWCCNSFLSIQLSQRLECLGPHIAIATHPAEFKRGEPCCNRSFADIWPCCAVSADAVQDENDLGNYFPGLFDLSLSGEPQSDASS